MEVMIYYWLMVDEASSESELVQVSVFPLTRMTFFPGTTKPLNIFEARYIEMVEEALRTGGLIALAYSEPSAVKSQGVGVLGHLRSIAGVGKVQLIERRSDGTMLILLVAAGKVKFEKILHEDDPSREKPYLRAEARWVKEDLHLSDSYLFLFHRLQKDLGRWLISHVASAEDREKFMAQLETPEQKINAISSMMVMDSEVQQTLLECDRLEDRCVQLAMAVEGESPAQ